MSKPRSIADLIKPGQSGFARLMARARAIQKLDQALASILDPGMAEHVRVASLQDGTLTLVAGAAAFATRLRMDQQELLRILRNQGAGRIERIKIRVAPLPVQTQAPAPKRELSHAAREALDRFAQDCGDPELRDVLRTVKKPAKQ